MPQSSFSKDMWHNGSHHERQCVCIRCEAVGLSTNDAQRYVCSQCGKEYGHKKFDRNALKHFRNLDRKTKLCCQQCQTERTSSSVAAKVRQRSLLSILQQPDAWRCTCKRIPRKQRADHALNQRNHSEHCALQPTSMGEPKRWDGKNKGITLKDLHFLL